MCIGGDGEMAQWLRALAALPEDLSSIPSNYMVVQNHLYCDLMSSSDNEVLHGNRALIPIYVGD